MADLRLIDAHVHLWDLSAHSWYPAMQDPEVARAWAGLGDVTRMARDFLFADYIAESTGCTVDGLVHVSATSAPRAYLQEARWIDPILDATGLPAAVIGAVEPTLSLVEIEADLSAQMRSRRFRGVRVLTGLDPDSAAADHICTWLAEQGLVFDLVMHPGEVDGFSRLIGRYPGLDIVLEHAGWPDGSGAEARAQWEAAVTRIADFPNTNCKLSGLGMAMHTLSADALRPWLETLLEIFGPARCLFGSNFPVEAMYGSYGELITAVEAALAGLGEAERAAVLGDNARRIYRLAPATAA